MFLWKYAKIRPVLKSNGVYRSVSLLSFPAKVFEKLILSKVICPFVLPHIQTNQFDFVPGRFTGTTTAVTAIKGHILNILCCDGGAVR